MMELWLAEKKLFRGSEEGVSFYLFRIWICSSFEHTEGGNLGSSWPFA